jgi:hypothetical protein
MFTICYTYQEKRVVTRLAVDHLTGHAAVSYALLHSGAAGKADQLKWPHDQQGITEIARGLGLTNVIFHRALGSRATS